MVVRSEDAALQSSESTSVLYRSTAIHSQQSLIISGWALDTASVWAGVSISILQSDTSDLWACRGIAPNHRRGEGKRGREGGNMF